MEEQLSEVKLNPPSELKVEIKHATVAELHCSKPYRERRVLKSIVFLIGALSYLGTMGGFTIYYATADFSCQQIFDDNTPLKIQPLPFPLTYWLAG